MISVAFGCPYEGHVPPERVLRDRAPAARRRRAGDRLRRHDRHGQPARRCGSSSPPPARRSATTCELTAHFHNTRGQGLANVLAALDAGVTLVRVELRRARRLPGAGRARPATSPPRTSCRCCTRWATRRASTSSALLAAARARAGGARAPARLAPADRRPGRLERRRVSAELAPLTTLRLGGPARRLVEADTEDELVEAVRAADAADEPLLVLGRRLERRDRRRGLRRHRRRTCARAAVERDGRRRCASQAGRAVGRARRAHASADGPAGVRVPVGHPGLDRRDADPERRRLRPGGRRDGRLGARARPRDRRRRDAARRRRAASPTARSVFKHDRRAGSSSRSPSRCASSASSGPLRYAELARTLGVGSAARRRWPTCARRCSRCAAARAWSIDPDDPDSVSAGSFFTNPILDAGDFAALARAAPPTRPPAFPEPDGRVKTSAAWLIERAGFATRLRRRPRRHLDQAHARARQPRRRDDRRARRAGARDRRRRRSGASASSSCPSRCSSGHDW